MPISYLHPSLPLPASPAPSLPDRHPRLRIKRVPDHITACSFPAASSSSWKSTDRPCRTSRARSLRSPGTQRARSAISRISFAQCLHTFACAHSVSMHDGNALWISEARARRVLGPPLAPPDRDFLQVQPGPCVPARPEAHVVAHHLDFTTEPSVTLSHPFN